MPASVRKQRLKVVEICAGAGGQSLGLERAGFEHALAVELDLHAAATLRHNLGHGDQVVRVGDVADPAVWTPGKFTGIDLLAGGVPCPPFSIAGKQLGAGDERDLFAWAIELCGRIKPRALLLENVRGLSSNRFSAYRQHVLDRLHEYGYVGEWKLLHASDYGVPQLRPRFVLVAMLPEYAEYFEWPSPSATQAPTVGEVLADLMADGGWESHEVERWVNTANDIAPTIVGGSKKHGGADLGPTRAKRAWAALGVDAKGVADGPPGPGWMPIGEAPGPRLTTEMVARIQGWHGSEFAHWEFLGRKTTVYRQIGNAFPPPVAKAVGESIMNALCKFGTPRQLIETTSAVHDPVYKLLRGSTRPLSVTQIVARLTKAGLTIDQPTVERHLAHLSHDFEISTVDRATGETSYSLGEFRAFTGQEGHQRHDLFIRHRAKIS
ncbi:DNA cytosine methyltransferase [Prescottella equi]|uniref:DNA cytosine methyltransferase n=1 Tax=Rhodococcus hoagii TaxID=43767 RepID=UPI001C780DBD|nr:DNA (cytosine-5-)-methyltransferase [Prescottella equi]BCN78119.1 DNA cytosine methyltransferase [Prescottella equi]